MRKVSSLFFAVVMMFSIVFISEAMSSTSPFSTQAQVTVKRKNNGGLVGKTTRGSKYIYRKGKNGVVYTYRKTKQGTVYVGKKTYQGGKYATKKTVKGTKYVGKKTVGGTKKVFSKTKKVVVGN